MEKGKVGAVILAGGRGSRIQGYLQTESHWDYRDGEADGKEKI